MTGTRYREPTADELAAISDNYGDPDDAYVDELTGTAHLAYFTWDGVTRRAVPVPSADDWTVTA